MYAGSRKVELHALQRELSPDPPPLRSSPRPIPLPPPPRPRAELTFARFSRPAPPPSLALPALPPDVVPAVSRYFPLSLGPRFRVCGPKISPSKLDPATARPQRPSGRLGRLRSPGLAAAAEAGSALGHQDPTSPGLLRSLHLAKQSPPPPPTGSRKR